MKFIMLSKTVEILMLFCFVKVLSVHINNCPIIGIVTEEVDETSSVSGKSYLTASYVKFIEASGARVIPIWIYKPERYYWNILSKINGVLFPGGSDILKSKGFGRTGKIIFDIAIEMNKNGNYFPLWGTCLGFELLTFAASGERSWMKLCSAEDWVTSIDFVHGYSTSRMFSKLSDELKTVMSKDDVAIHFHHWCLTPKNYSISGLDKFFKVLATNEDSKGEIFISVIEAFDYPFYGVAFHPEKIMFDWSHMNVSIPHTDSALRVSQFFSNFFVNEAKKNQNKFLNKSEENSLLIYNYCPRISGKDPSNQEYDFQFL